MEIAKKNDIINIYNNNGGSMARVLVSMPEDFLGQEANLFVKHCADISAKTQ